MGILKPLGEAESLSQISIFSSGSLFTDALELWQIEAQSEAALKVGIGPSF